MEVSVKEARNSISKLLDRTQRGEEILISRRGKKVARLVPVDISEKRLPDLSDFRASIAVRGLLSVRLLSTLGTRSDIEDLFSARTKTRIFR